MEVQLHQARCPWELEPWASPQPSSFNVLTQLWTHGTFGIFVISFAVIRCCNSRLVQSAISRSRFQVPVLAPDNDLG